MQKGIILSIQLLSASNIKSVLADWAIFLKANHLNSLVIFHNTLIINVMKFHLSLVFS